MNDFGTTRTARRKRGGCQRMVIKVDFILREGEWSLSLLALQPIVLNVGRQQDAVCPIVAAVQLPVQNAQMIR